MVEVIPLFANEDEGTEAPAPSPQTDSASATRMAAELRALIGKIAQAAELIRGLGGVVQENLQSETVSSLGRLLRLVETEGRRMDGFEKDGDAAPADLAHLGGQLDRIVRGLEGLALLNEGQSLLNEGQAGLARDAAHSLSRDTHP